VEKTALSMFRFIEKFPNCTELEIARGVGLKKTPYTRLILFSLIEHGHIARIWDEERHPHAYVYYLQTTQPLDIP